MSVIMVLKHIGIGFIRSLILGFGPGILNLLKLGEDLSLGSRQSKISFADVQDC